MTNKILYAILPMILVLMVTPAFADKTIPFDETKFTVTKINVGEIVTWTPPAASFPHHVAFGSPENDDGRPISYYNLQPSGTSFNLKFTQDNVRVDYYCKVHKVPVGTIIVGTPPEPTNQEIISKLQNLETTFAKFTTSQKSLVAELKALKDSIPSNDPVLTKLANMQTTLDQLSANNTNQPSKHTGLIMDIDTVSKKIDTLESSLKIKTTNDTNTILDKIVTPKDNGKVLKQLSQDHTQLDKKFISLQNQTLAFQTSMTSQIDKILDWWALFEAEFLNEDDESDEDGDDESHRHPHHDDDDDYEE